MGSGKAKDGKALLDSSKYVRYTPEQVEILEHVYKDCPKPSSSRRQQLIKECPILSNIGQKQLKVWFQNRRCREKQRKETGRLQTWNSKLNAMNQLLVEENERLQKQTTQLVSENYYLRQQLQVPSIPIENQRALPQSLMGTTDISSESVATSGHQYDLHSPPCPSSQRWALSQLLAVAEKNFIEFVLKASGSLANGVPFLGMKPGPESIAVLSQLCGGAAAPETCSLVDLEPSKVAEIAKIRPSWLHNCRRLEILATFNDDRGGIAELVHTQMYALMTCAAPRDFCTLRYTSSLKDGSLVICEKSLSSGQDMQTIPTAQGFVRADMLLSGFLIRPCEQGRSLVVAVGDMNLKALPHLSALARKKGGVGSVNDATLLCGFSHRLVRGFNDAVNCFLDEGWIPVVEDGTTSAVSVHINPRQFEVSESNIKGGIICVKASVLLENVPPAFLVHYLRERRIAWTDFDNEIREADFGTPALHGNNLLNGNSSSSQTFQPITGQDEVLEVVRLPRLESCGNVVDNFLLQLCSSITDAANCTHSQLIFSPIDASVPDDTPLLPSGFRVTCSEGHREKPKVSETLDLASTLETGSEDCHSVGYFAENTKERKSVVMVAFQYMYEEGSRDIVALKAQQHMRSLMSFLQQAAFCGHPSLVPSSSMGPPSCGLDALVLVRQLVESYRFYLGRELFLIREENMETLLRNFWMLRHSIICCAWKPLPEFIFANCSALQMLETSLSALREMSLDRMFSDGCKKTDYTQPPPFIQEEGCTCLPAGVCITSTGRPVSFEHAIGWKVMTGDDSIQVAAFMFCNWSFVPGCT